MNTYYTYWDKILSKHEKKARELKIKWFEINFPQYQLDHLYKKGKLTEEQYEELTKRFELYKEVKAFGYFTVREQYKNDEFFNKYYFWTEKRYANGKTLNEMF
jgi:hypothetical protein